MEREHLEQPGDYDPALPQRLAEIVRQIVAEREAARKGDDQDRARPGETPRP